MALNMAKLILKIEKTRNKMYYINPQEKDKLLKISRKLDELIVKYQKALKD